jgi:antitoxin VapB
MLEMSHDTEALVRAKAASVGLTPDEVVRAALSRVGDVLPWRSLARPRPPAETKDDLIAGMEEIAVRSAARGVLDPRSPDEIIGYDDFGLPR